LFPDNASSTAGGYFSNLFGGALQLGYRAILNLCLINTIYLVILRFRHTTRFRRNDAFLSLLLWGDVVVMGLVNLFVELTRREVYAHFYLFLNGFLLLHTFHSGLVGKCLYEY
jgi:hypothetical protein